MDDIFKTASRKQFLYPSVLGSLMTDQLWSLPLQSKNGADLDTVARGINNSIKAMTEESFVTPNRKPGMEDLEIKLEVVKAVIEYKVKQAEEAEARVVRDAKRRKILDALASKEDQELSGASKEDLLKQLAEIDG